MSTRWHQGGAAATSRLVARTTAQSAVQFRPAGPARSLQRTWAEAQHKTAVSSGNTSQKCCQKSGGRAWRGKCADQTTRMGRTAGLPSGYNAATNTIPAPPLASEHRKPTATRAPGRPVPRPQSATCHGSDSHLQAQNSRSRVN